MLNLKAQILICLLKFIFKASNNIHVLKDVRDERNILNLIGGGRGG